MEQYQLLRSNKQSGPFTANELIKMGFKPYDLIWAENKSAAWRYPSEMAEFKMYAPIVEEQPFDRFYKKKETVTTKNISSAAIPPQATITKKEKPRIKIKADCKKIEMVNSTPVIINQQKLTITSAKEPSWESAWLNWEEEKKQANVLNTHNKTVEKNNGLVYGEDISGLASDSALYDFSPKKTALSYTTIISTSVLVLALVGAGIWFGVKWAATEHKKDKPILTAQVENNTGSKDAGIINTDAIIEDAKNVSAPQNSNTEEEEYPIAASFQTDQKKDTQKKTSPAQIKKDKQVLPPPNTTQQNKQLSGQETAARNNVQQQITPVQAKPVSSQINNEDIFEKKKKPEPKISQYVQLHQQAQTPGAQYEIENTSDINIELVMIDLQYYDKGGKYLKGETMYVRNIAPGELAKIKTPIHNTAQKVTAKISMISSAEKDLYLIAD